jgi:hypothetical protein
VRIGDGPVFPVVNVAIITALAFGLAPYLVRPLRRVFAVVILLVCASAMYLGAGFPADVIGGLLIGFAVAALVRVVFGSPGGQPSIAEVRDALVDLGYEPAFGARPLRRAILREIQDPLAEEILKGGYPPGTTIKVDVTGEDFTFSKA